MRDHFADYTPAQRRAIVDELRRRRLPVPRPTIGGGRGVLDVLATGIGIALAGLLLVRGLAALLR